MFISVKDIKKDQVFYECESGFNDKYQALTDAYQENDGWAVDAQDDQNNTIHFYAHAGYASPNLYTCPQYA